MKLTNLSLAVMVAVGVAACGGSGDDNSNKPADPPKQPTPNQPQQPQQPEAPTNPQQAVDPTGSHVVDDKDLTKEKTVGTLNYIRRDGSRYDRTLNPSKPASASPLLGTSLDEQNPSLTNIVLARQDTTRADGTPVKAQFAGSDNPMPLTPAGNAIKDSVTGGNSLQEENFANVDVLSGRYLPGSKAEPESAKGTSPNRTDYHVDDGTDIDGANNVDLKGKLKARPNGMDPTNANSPPSEPKAGDRLTGGWGFPYVEEDGNGGYVLPEVMLPSGIKARTGKIIHHQFEDQTKPDYEAFNDGVTYQATGNEYGSEGEKGVYRQVTDISDPAHPKTYAAVISDARTTTAVIDPYAVVRKESGAGLTNPKNFKKITTKDVKGLKEYEDVYMYRGSTPPTASSKRKQTVTPAFAEANGVRYGKDLVWWTSQAEGFENTYTRQPPADAYTKSLFDSGYFATNGLIRVGGGLATLGQELNYNKEEKKWEDHHKSTTRIFGRYHLAYAGTNEKNKGIHPVTLNSFKGAKTFIAEYETDAARADLGTAKDKAGKTTLYSIGAEPMSLKYVQYGRVTTNLDLDEGEKGYPDGFLRNPFGRKGDDNTVDNYFYRGTHATSIEQMAALPSNQTAVYNGHALMYGIDNSYHGGGGRNLPNAFAGATTGLGLGNFVEARVDFGKKRVLGEVYNEWLLDQTKSTTTRDKLVRFQGNIIGNTVLGSADRTYVAGDDCAIFKASFFGEKAEEMGGSFNTVQDTSKYGDAYGQNDWGGVFGASKGSSGNTFQGDDGSNNYGNNNATNNYNE